MSLFRMNWSFCTVSKSLGSLMMILRTPFSCDSGRTTFSRATDSGTSSTTAAGMVTSVRSMNCMPWNSAMALIDLLGGGVAELDEGVVELGAGLLRDAAGFFELVGAEDLLADEDVGEIAARLGHGKHISGVDGVLCRVKDRRTARKSKAEFGGDRTVGICACP